MKIRKATLKDFSQLKKLKKEFFLLECKRDSRMNSFWVKTSLGKRLGKNLRKKNTIFFVAEEKSRLIGYAGAEIVKNPSFVKFKKRGHLFNLYVLPNYQKKKVGRQLLQAVLQWFKQHKIVDQMIMVYADNKIAYHLYKKAGFKNYILELRR